MISRAKQRAHSVLPLFAESKTKHQTNYIQDKRVGTKMPLFSCGGARKHKKAPEQPRPNISRPLEVDQLHNGYHARESRTFEGIRRRREASRCKDQERSRGQGYRDSQLYPAEFEQCPSMQEIYSNERYRPRGRNENQVRAPSPPVDDRWRGAYDQLNRWDDRRGEARPLRVVNRTPPPTAPANQTWHRGLNRATPQACQGRPHPTPGSQPDQNPWNSDAGLARPKNTHPSPPSSKRSSSSSSNSSGSSSDPERWRRNYDPRDRNLLGAAPDDDWMKSSGIMRGRRPKPAPKDGKRVLYNCDDATATRRNMGW